jgi:hypothetical protein
MPKAKATIEEGAVIRVRDWPETTREQFVVKAIFDVPGSPYPRQVSAYRIDKSSGGARLAALRTFPLELCEVDPKASIARTAFMQRVRQRLGKENDGDV